MNLIFLGAVCKKNGMENTKENARIAAEEALVEQTVKGGVHGLVDEFLSKVMRWARKIFPNLSMTKVEARDFMRRADSMLKGDNFSQHDGFLGKTDGKWGLKEAKYNVSGRQIDKKIKITDVDPSAIPVDIKDTKALRSWLLENIRNPVTIEDTSVTVLFTHHGLKDSLKRRGFAQRSTYQQLGEIIRNSVYYGSIPADQRHQGIEGQDIYLSAMKIGDKFYSVRIKLDIEKQKASRNYKDHKVSEIEIAPLVNTTQNAIEADALSTRIGAIDTLKLSDLIASVKKDNDPDIRYSLKDRKPATLSDLGVSTEYKDLKKTDENGNETTERQLIITGNFRAKYDELMKVIGGKYKYDKEIGVKGFFSCRVLFLISIWRLRCL